MSEDSELPAGLWVRGLLTGDSFTSDGEFFLLDANGNSVTMQAGQRFILHGCIISNGATPSTYTLYGDSRDEPDSLEDFMGPIPPLAYVPGFEYFSVTLPANRAIAFPAGQGYIYGRQGNGFFLGLPVVVASADSVGSSVTIFGRIVDT